MILGIAGHRSGPKLGGFNDSSNLSRSIKQILREKFQQLKPDYILSGMAIGVNQWAVEVAMELSIKTIAMIPCAGQERLWPRAAQERYHDLLEQVTKKLQLSDQPYHSDLMKKCDEAIAGTCDQLLAIWDSSSGGTMHCVWSARKAGKPVLAIHPVTRKETSY